MTSIEDKLQTLQNKVSSLDKTSDIQEGSSSNNSYNKYIYVLVVFFICLFVIVWLKPSFIVNEEENVHKGRVVKTKKLNKTRTGVCAAIMSGTVIGGWYWYKNKN